MQKIISHRGNVNGPEKSKENKWTNILKAADLGFDVEIDLWWTKNAFWLGHDKPQDELSFEDLMTLKYKIWIHCKNLECLNFFCKYGIQADAFNFFWHQNDDFTLTSLGFIWTFPKKPVTDKSIIVDLENKKNAYNCYGICTDYPGLYL